MMSSAYDETSTSFNDTFTIESPPPVEARNNWIPACLIGCFLMFVACGLLCAGIVWYVASNAKKIASNLARDAIVGTVEQSDLESNEKRAIIAQVDRVVDQYQAGEISTEDLGRIMEELAESPLMGAILIRSVELHYVEPSGLDDAEKEQARRTLQRVLRGLYEKQLTTEELEPAMDHISYRDAQGNRQLKQQISDEELRRFLAACRERVEAAEIPDEPYEVQISQELKRAIDRALDAQD
jgi:hypothetical protein